MENNMAQMKKMINSMDDAISKILTNKESFAAMRESIGYIREDADSINHNDPTSMALAFRDMYHKIVMIDDLIHFVCNDFEKNFKDAYELKDKMDFLIKDDE